MKKYVSTDYTGCDCITAGKLYELQGEFRVIDDEGDEAWVCLDSCLHLDCNSWTVHEVGTLAELDVKAGDVVEFIMSENYTYTVMDDMYLKSDRTGDRIEYHDMWALCDKFRIISRAQPKPTPFGEMSDAEQAALLLAHHRGEVIETMGLTTTTPYDVSHQWMRWTPTIFRDDCAYRIAPAEPKRETLTMYAKPNKHGNWIGSESASTMTHRITFDTIDGVPDCASVKMVPVT